MAHILFRFYANCIVCNTKKILVKEAEKMDYCEKIICYTDKYLYQILYHVIEY
jgi:hypothetical protein